MIKLVPSRFCFGVECRDRRFRSEAPPLPGGKARRQHTAAVELEALEVDAAVLSPRFFAGGLGGMGKSSTEPSRSRSETFPSPGTPNYHRNGGANAAYQKGWSSERVPLPSNGSRRHGGSGVVLPFNNGRRLPSKWEDAEKWVLSPVSGEGAGRLSVRPPHHRRPKSKSGPLGHPGGIDGAYLSVSPLVPHFEDRRAGNFAATSPFLEGVLIPEHGDSHGHNNGVGVVDGAINSDDSGDKSYPSDKEPYILRSASVHGWSDTLMRSSSSMPVSRDAARDEKLSVTREKTHLDSPAILRKDVATQMSPEGSNASAKERLSFASSPSANPVEDIKSHISKPEVRDVQIDDQVAVTKWSKKHVMRSADKRSSNIVEYKKKTIVATASSWEEKQTARCMSKSKREEAKIMAWENLQKAKAEEAIRKLEMKLEKKRSSSMYKILNKLRSAQKKAQDMRNAATASQAQSVARTTRKPSYFGKTRRISSLGGCFTCHAC